MKTARETLAERADLLEESLCVLRANVARAHDCVSLLRSRIHNGTPAGSLPLPIALSDTAGELSTVIRRWGRLEESIETSFNEETR